MLVERAEITQQSNKLAPFYSLLHTHSCTMVQPKKSVEARAVKKASVLLLVALPTVYLLSKKTGLDKDYYPALLKEGLKPAEGQGPA